MPTSSVESTQRPTAQLEVRDFIAGYGRIPIVSSINLDVGEGEVVAIVGPNGAGKSTLLKAIVGVIPSLGGSIRLRGDIVTNLSTDDLVRRGIGYVPQSHDVFDSLTVEENMRIGGYLLAKPEAEARMARILDTFPTLRPLIRRIAHKLSGGERKLVAIARVMMLQPSLYVLDEPTSNLSVELAHKLLTDYVRRIASTGAAVLLVEQKAKAALEVSNWAYLMVAGVISMSSPAAMLLADESIAHRFLGKVTTGSSSAPPGGTGPDSTLPEAPAV
jgi:ABC-type branched-subunit amino acid transport system ATPase component